MKIDLGYEYSLEVATKFHSDKVKLIAEKSVSGPT